MLSNGGLRSHAFGVLVENNTIQLLYYDRSRPVRSKPVYFLKKPIILVAVLKGITTWTHCQWFVPVIRLPPPSLLPPLSSPSLEPPTSLPFRNETIPTPSILRDPFNGAQLTLNNGVTLELGQQVFQQHAIICPGTRVLRAKVAAKSKTPNSWKDESIIVKFSFTPRTRMREGHMLARIIECASIPEYHWVLDHLPKILHYEELSRNDRDLQTRFAKYFKEKNHEYEDRVLQILVMTELFPITDLTTTDLLAPVIKRVFKCEYP